MQIIPAILTSDAEDFKSQIIGLLPYYSAFQIDVQDGIFVPSMTLGLQEVYDALMQIKRERGDVFTSITFDFHLMLSDYSEASNHLISASEEIPIRNIFVHKNYSEGRSQLNICASLNPEDGIESFIFDPLLCPAIQVMTINPGPQGQEIDLKNLDKVKMIRMADYKGEIFIDGSVNKTSLTEIMAMENMKQPDAYCVGSFLSKATGKELQERIVELNRLMGF